MPDGVKALEAMDREQLLMLCKVLMSYMMKMMAVWGI